LRQDFFKDLRKGKEQASCAGVMGHMIKRILSIFRRRADAEEVAQDILQEIMQHMARRQMEIEESQKRS
jgi:hypothetical protein